MPKYQIGQQGFVHLLLVIAGLIILGTASASVISTTNEFPQQNNPSVLGEDEEIKQIEESAKIEAKAEEKKIKEEIKNEERKIKEDENKIREIKKEEAKQIKETEKQEMKKIIELLGNLRSGPDNINREVKIKTASNSGEEETEIETQDGTKIKTKTEKDGRVKFEIENNGLKMKFENGRLRIEREHEGSESAGLNDDETDQLRQEIEDELEDRGIEIASSSGRMSIIKNKRRALTKFPLSINPETNELVVTTPAGQKTVTVLPDQAVENMLSKSVLSDINDDGEENIEIEQRSDELVYKVKGEKDHKFLGFIPLKTKITAFVSAQTGELTAEEQSILSRIISQLSF